jgi:ribonuclease BN (tRNA processing enzyme)
MSNFALKCFGVGDGWACADRNHASFLYCLGDVSILIDCGEPVSGSFKAAGLACDSLDRIFISHLHCDHLAGFFMLMQGFWLEQRKKPLPVHLPADGIKPVSQLLEASLIFPELLRFRLKYHALRAGKSILTRGVRVTPFRSSHLDSLRRAFQKDHPQRFEAFCFLIEAGRRRIGHSADLGRPEDLEPLLRRPLDLLVCELAHFAPEDLFRHLRGRKIKRLIFVHLAREHWQNLNRTRRLAAKLLPGIPCSFARDHQEFSF